MLYGKKSRPKIFFENEEILEPLLSAHLQLQDLIFASASILLVVASLIFSILSGFSLANLDSFNLLAKLSFGVLLVCSLIAILICLEVIRPKLAHKKPQSDFYFMDVFNRFHNKEEYMVKLGKLSQKDEGVAKFFIDEYYELGKNVLLPKFKLIKLATEVLIIGIVLSVILFVCSFF